MHQCKPAEGRVIAALNQPRGHASQSLPPSIRAAGVLVSAGHISRVRQQLPFKSGRVGGKAPMSCARARKPNRRTQYMVDGFATLAGLPTPWKSSKPYIDMYSRHSAAPSVLRKACEH